MKPINKNLNLYKGRTFKVQFRIRSGGEAQLPSFVEFKAMPSGGDTAALSRSTDDDPATITIDADEENLISVEFSPAETSAITEIGHMDFEINARFDDISEGDLLPYWSGQLKLIEGIPNAG